MLPMNSEFDTPLILRANGAESFLRLDPKFTEVVGFTADEITAQPMLDWIHPEDRSSLESILNIAGGRVTARHRTKSGQWLAFDWQTKPHADGYAILGKANDIQTEIEPAVGNPSSSHSTMSETLATMARIVEARNPDMLCSILLMDPDGEFVSVGAGPSFPQEYNDAVEGLIIGPTVGSCGTAAFWNVPVVVVDIALDPLWRNLRDAAAIAGVRACWSVPILAADGKVLGAMALYSRTPATPTENQMHGLEIAARMVGLAIERDRLEAQLRQAAKMEAIGVLAGGVAHDFNNLLAVVLGNAELALDTLGPNSTSTKLLEDITSATHSAMELCHQMLAYAGKGAMSAEVHDFNSLVKDLSELLQVVMSKKATLSYELEAGPLGVLGDGAQLGQVIMNLITNASEAIGDETGRVIVSTSTHVYAADDPALRRADSQLEPGEYVRLRVSDTGIGMNEKTRARIFDPFFSTKTAGRGLGLAAVHGIVVNHNGIIALDSVPGDGSMFTVLFPRMPLVAGSITPTVSPRDDSVGAQILVVDDEPLVRRIMTRILEFAGYSVILANDGQEAVDVYREKADSIDCVLLDLSMPRLSGIEAYAEIRKIRENARVILSSGFAEQDIMTQVGCQGLVGAVQKPVHMDDLLGKIAEALGGKTEQNVSVAS